MGGEGSCEAGRRGELEGWEERGAVESGRRVELCRLGGEWSCGDLQVGNHKHSLVIQSPFPSRQQSRKD